MIRKEIRSSCGLANITQEECVKKLCCYDEAGNGTCFTPLSKLIFKFDIHNDAKMFWADVKN